jgi:hypothetical protein
VKSERALAKLTAAAVKASAELSSCYGHADALPLDIAKQLAVAAEEVDFLRHLLHQVTAQAAIHGPAVLNSRPDDDELEALLR